MKDAYSFDLTAEEAGKKSYNRMFVAYLRTYERTGPESYSHAGGHGAHWR